MSTAVQRGIAKLTTCSCGRPKPFGFTTKCELCKFLGIEIAPTADQLEWLSDAGALNPQVKLIGFSKEKQCCVNCVHFKKVDHAGRSKFEHWRTICANYIDDKAFKPYWPACHNFQLCRSEK